MRKCAVIGILFLCFSLSQVQALEVSGVRLPTTARVGEQDLALRGADLLRWKWVVKIYVAALYLPPQLTRAQALDEGTRRIAFHYRRGFTAEQLVEATNGTITRGLDPAVATAIKPQLDAFNALYRPVKEGDVMAIDYQVGVGTTMRLNNVVIGTVPGADFARALFAIWLGDQAVDDDLKDALLGAP
jgi:Chalcone isomerase-like